MLLFNGTRQRERNPKHNRQQVAKLTWDQSPSERKVRIKKKKTRHLHAKRKWMPGWVGRWLYSSFFFCVHGRHIQRTIVVLNEFALMCITVFPLYFDSHTRFGGKRFFFPRRTLTWMTCSFLCVFGFVLACTCIRRGLRHKQVCTSDDTGDRRWLVVLKQQHNKL